MQLNTVVQTPEQQLENFMLTEGNATPADVEFAKRWTKQETERRKREQSDAMRQREEGLRDKRADVDEALSDLTERSNELYETASRGDFQSTKDLFKLARGLRGRVASLEAVIASIEQSEATIQAAKEDPNWFSDFYAKYPSLAERLPRLDHALSDFRADPRSHRR